MTVSPRRLGAYAPLSATYAFDDAVMEAGEPAELLFVRSLAFCAQSDSDGYITRAQLVRYVGAGMVDAVARADRLVEVGIFDAVDGGWVVRSWLKWNQSAKEKGRERRRDRERKAASRAQARADSDQESTDSPDDVVPDVPGHVRPDSDRDSGRDSREQSDDTFDGQVAGLPPSVQNGAESSPCLDTEQDRTKKKTPSSAARPRAHESKPGSDDDPDWCRFWDVWPRKVDKGHARKMWATVVKNTDPAVIVAAAEQYRRHVAGSDPKFIPYPATWLNGERWTDDLHGRTPPTGPVESTPTGEFVWDEDARIAFEQWLPTAPRDLTGSAHQQWMREQRTRFVAERMAVSR